MNMEPEKLQTKDGWMEARLDGGENGCINGRWDAQQYVEIHY